MEAIELLREYEKEQKLIMEIAKDFMDIVWNPFCYYGEMAEDVIAEIYGVE